MKNGYKVNKLTKYCIILKLIAVLQGFRITKQLESTGFLENNYWHFHLNYSALNGIVFL